MQTTLALRIAFTQAFIDGQAKVCPSIQRKIFVSGGIILKARNRTKASNQEIPESRAKEYDIERIVMISMIAVSSFTAGHFLRWFVS